jgi:hypothetical protein
VLTTEKGIKAQKVTPDQGQRGSAIFSLTSLLFLFKKKTPLAGDCGVFIETETLTVF